MNKKNILKIIKILTISAIAVFVIMLIPLFFNIPLVTFKNEMSADVSTFSRDGTYINGGFSEFEKSTSGKLILTKFDLIKPVFTYVYYYDELPDVVYFYVMEYNKTNLIGWKIVKIKFGQINRPFNEATNLAIKNNLMDYNGEDGDINIFDIERTQTSTSTVNTTELQRTRIALEVRYLILNKSDYNSMLDYENQELAGSELPTEEYYKRSSSLRSAWLDENFPETRIVGDKISLETEEEIKKFYKLIYSEEFQGEDRYQKILKWFDEKYPEEKQT